MGSLNAQLVAGEIARKIRKGQKVSVSRIMREVGYSANTASRLGVTKTKAFQTALALETKDIVADLDRELREIQIALANKDKNSEDYKTLIASMDVIIKNKQLLSGGSTENVGIQIAISEHVAGKYNKSASDVNSENGSTEP